ncbi:MAG TPA: DUF4105 domain-containing protein, partial [Longimicrobiales bacterium]|nr:DUF4105 domain-containing protein [Longimicrobiales bacterium]
MLSFVDAAAAVGVLQEPPPQGARAPAGSSLRIYLLTAGPGDAVWERFGHNALRIVDEAAGTDVSWNWGLFSFDQEGFVLRLLRGTMLYWMGGFPTEATLQEYRATDRAVWAQELDLTPAEKEAVQASVLESYRPENRYYRYDYYRDNCSTRIRDILDAALGGRIRAATRRPTATTYRWHTRRLLRDVPWAYAGIELVLGNRADEPITGWQEMFIPMKLRSHLSGLTVERDGSEVPLVKEERLLLPSDRGPVPDAPPFRLPVFLVVGLLWGGLVLLLGRAAAAGAWLPRAGLVLVAGLWSVVAALAGLVLLGAWAFTDHVFWGWNENVLQVDPLSAGLVVGLTVLLVRPRLPTWVPGL